MNHRLVATGIALALLGAAADTRGLEAGSCASCPEASFGPASRIVASNVIYAQSVVIADFDGDGNPDLAVGRNQGVTVLPGAGGGRFASPQETSLNGVPELAVGDFNEDGIPDLAALGYDGLSILIGGGSGRFSTVLAVSGFATFAVLAVGDFDHDGHLDAVLGGIGSQNNSISLYRGDGQGHLAFAGNFPTGLPYPNSPWHLAVGDFNGDGYADLAVSGNYSDFSVFLGGPSGFAPAIPVGASQSFTDLKIADIDGDGKPDVLASIYFGDVLFYPGDGTGHFGPAQHVNMGGGPYALAIADVNGDGKLDLAAVSYQYNYLLIRLGDGAGGFGAAQRFGIVSPNSLAIADLDGDGLPDFATANGVNVSVEFGDGSGGIQALVFPGGTAPEDIVVADFDGDGHPDIAMALPNSSGGGLTVRFGDGLGGFGPSMSYPQPASLTSLVAADFNGDLKPDLVGKNGPYGTFILLNDGTGHFLPPASVTTSCSGFSPPAVGDLSGDGKLDLVIACDNAFSVLLGNGAGGFGSPILTSAFPGRWFALGDVNGDGKLDIVSGNNSYQIATFLGDGTGHFSSPVISVTPHFGVGGIVLADFDGDGKLDVATSAFSQGNNLDVLFGDGTGAFVSPRSFPMFATTVRLGADVNGDGRPDVVAILSDSIEILMNDGHGDFLPSRSYISGAVPSAVAAGDFNGDGKQDLVSSNGFEDSFTLFLNTNCQPRHLALAPRFPGCSAAASPIAPAPVVSVFDDGGNVSACATGTVTAALLAGPQGAGLSGTTTVTIDAGLATFGNLAITAPGSSLLGFTHSGAARPARGLFHIGTPRSVAIVGPSSVCGKTPALYDAGAGYSRYLWTLDGIPISFEQTASLGFLTAGSHTLAVRVSQEGCEAEGSMLVANLPPGVTSISPTSGSSNGGTALTVGGACFATGATLTLGNAPATSVNVSTSGSLSAVSGAHEPGLVDAVVTNPDGQSGTLSSAYSYVASFYTVTPCRLVDTRSAPGPLGGPALQAGSTRTFALSGHCGIPPTAAAVAVNLAVFLPDGGGDLRVYPAGRAAPLASSINFRPGIVRANNAIVSLGSGAQISVQCDMDSPTGSTHFFLDVFGYFQ